MKTGLVVSETGHMLLMMIHQTKAIAGSDGNVDAVTSLTLDA